MAGSIWNSNSWHWEEKNYNKWGKSYIENKLSNLKIEKDGFYVYFDTFDISGNASVYIRKGKQINSFEYVIKFNWNFSKMGQDKECVGGNIQILDFSNSNKELKLMTEEEEKMKNVGMENNHQNQPYGVIPNILHNANHTHENEEEQKKDGSIWNINNYHWEEKCLTRWAKEELKNILDNSKIELSNNIFLQFFSSEVEGEASSSIRKKKKILIYDFKINCEWKAYKQNKSSEIEMETKGHVSVSEVISDFSSEDQTKYKFNFIFDNVDAEYSTMNEVIKTEGPTQIEKIIDSFISRMKDK
ncbi:activator of Hsp90 ATPase [Plasmodium gonderi]|uniref:Activator of Hsp90 ATPase n=1 Tax=Plasmodium gonderi TaxID=77519 RepID=A0A1Y1JE30_PLAGO|nr:activator of Hsp90 ATPase [Plasmodium gonderi]GAW80756.1 activator of Hsp90 ATPase [Plasmodium gonderi]